MNRRTLKPAAPVLIGPVSIREVLHALPARRVCELDPRLNPKTVRSQKLLKRLDALGAADLAPIARLFKRDTPAPGNIGILRRVERPFVQIVVLGQGFPIGEHADDAEQPVVPANRSPHAVLAAEHSFVALATENNNGFRTPI